MKIGFDYAKSAVHQIICEVAPIDVNALQNVVFLVLAGKPEVLKLAVRRLDGEKIPFLASYIDFKHYLLIPDFAVSFFGAHSKILEKILKIMEKEGLIEIRDGIVQTKARCDKIMPWIADRLEVIKEVELTPEMTEELAMPFLGYFDEFGKGLVFQNYVLDVLIGQIVMLYVVESTEDSEHIVRSQL